MTDIQSAYLGVPHLAWPGTCSCHPVLLIYWFCLGSSSVQLVQEELARVWQVEDGFSFFFVLVLGFGGEQGLFLSPTGLKLTTQIICFCLPSDGIKGEYHSGP